MAEAVTALGGVIVGAGGSTREALELAERSRPDVLILAVGLRDGDGVEAARAVMDRVPCPIVLLTSRTDAGVVRRARDAGIMAFLVKPLRPEELEPAMELAAGRFRELDAIRRENEDLKKAMESRKLVERAKGLLMSRHGLSEAEAFRKIQKTAMDSRRPMVEVARALLLVERLEGTHPRREQSAPR